MSHKRLQGEHEPTGAAAAGGVAGPPHGILRQPLVLAAVVVLLASIVLSTGAIAITRAVGPWELTKPWVISVVILMGGLAALVRPEMRVLNWLVAIAMVGSAAWALPRLPFHLVYLGGWHAVDLGLAFWVYFITPCAFLTASFLRRPVKGAGRCQQCGYDLTGNESGVCPECGTKTEQSHA